MPDVLLACHPFKILDAIVSLFSVLMVHLWKTAWVWNKGTRHEAMNQYLFTKAIRAAKRNPEVTLGNPFGAERVNPSLVSCLI